MVKMLIYHDPLPLAMVGSSEKDGTATSPDAQIIFADMYVTRTLAAAV